MHNRSGPGVFPRSARILRWVKTRTLLLLALACGIAIMIAGAAFLIQLSNTDEPEPASALGDEVRVAGMTVTVNGSDESDGTLTVDVELWGSPEPAPAEGFRLIASGRPVPVAADDCPAIDSAVATCTLTFDVTSADSPSRVLFYDRGDDGARWVLDD